MSNNLFLQPFDKPKSPTSNQHMLVETLVTGPDFHNEALQQISLSNVPITSNKKVSTTNMHTGWVDVQINTIGPQQFMTSNNKFREWGSMLDIVWNKRKTPTESLSSNYVQQRAAVSNKKPKLVDHMPWMQQLPLPSISNIPADQHLQPVDEKVKLMDSILKITGPRSSRKKSKVAWMQSSPKTQADSFGPVRSKLRESLAAALALVTQQQAKPNSHSENNEVSAVNVEAPNHVSENPTEDLPCSNGATSEKHNEECSTSHETTMMKNTGNFTHTSMCVVRHEFQLNPPMPEIDIPFGGTLAVKDDLLQGNGLSWTLDVDTDVEEKKEVQNKLVDVVLKEQESPETLGYKIEAKLFKLFGGVNKKYKEKGRSLIFNLKDPSNPELRERLMSGDISPERLCSMTAEELASKELSEWRIAKAEEFAHMVVLPDSDADIKRLVKKTHKGEFEVEYHEEETVDVGATSLPPILPNPNPSSNNDEPKHDLSSITENNNLKEGEVRSTLTIPPNEEAEVMLDELKNVDFLPPIVSLDEFMESLDSEPPFKNLPCDSEKLASPLTKVESKLKSSDSSKNSSDTTENLDVKISKTETVVKSSDNSVLSVTLPEESSKDEQIWEGSLQLNSSAVITVTGFYKSGEKTSTKEWANLLEIKGRVKLDEFEKFIRALSKSRSRAVMVTHLVLKQGSDDDDRTSLSEVMDSYILEERVGLAKPCNGTEIYICPAHAKILKVLPKQHTEALTVINNGVIGVVVMKKKVAESKNLSSSSPHKQSSKKKQSQNLHLSSDKKKQHHGKDDPGSVHRNLVHLPENSTSKPIVLSSGGRSVHGNLVRPPGNGDDGNDDLPPGFGPGAIKDDDDDLPEFNFSSAKSTQVINRGSNRFNSQPPVKQIEDLRYKFGKPDLHAGSRKLPEKTNFRWKDDDDDDIPEWQPQSLQQKSAVDDDIPEWQPQSLRQKSPPVLLPPPPLPEHVFHQQMIKPHMVNQHRRSTGQLQNLQIMPMQYAHPPMGAVQDRQNGGAWVAPPPPPPPPPSSPHGYRSGHGSSKRWS